MQFMQYCHCSAQCPQSVNLSDCAALTHFASVIGCIYWTSSCHALFSSSVGETWIWHWRLCGFHASPGFARRKTDVRPRGPWPHCLLLKVAVVDEAAVFSKTWDVKQTLDFHRLLRFCLQANLYSFLPFWTMTSFCISLQRFAWIWFFKLTMPTWSTDLSIHGSLSGKPTVQPWVCVQVCFTSLPGRTPERTTEWVSSVLPPRSWQMPAMLQSHWEENIPVSAFAGRTLHGEYIK